MTGQVKPQVLAAAGTAHGPGNTVDGQPADPKQSDTRAATHAQASHRPLKGSECQQAGTGRLLGLSRSGGAAPCRRLGAPDLHEGSVHEPTVDPSAIRRLGLRRRHSGQRGARRKPARRRARGRTGSCRVSQRDGVDRIRHHGPARPGAHDRLRRAAFEGAGHASRAPSVQHRQGRRGQGPGARKLAPFSCGGKLDLAAGRTVDGLGAADGGPACAPPFNSAT